MRATDGTLRIAALSDGEYRRLAGQLMAASVFMALAVALFLCVRRAAGALSAPLPLPQLMATAVAVTIWAITVRQISSRRRLYICLAAIAVLMLAVACSYPGTRTVDWPLWGCALAAIIWLPTKRRVTTIHPANRIATSAESESDGESETVLQQLTRVRTDEGHDAIRGLLAAEFAAGERQATLHVAFCPPFERLPQVEVNLADDADATVKLAQVLHNGAQLEVRLAQSAAEPTSVAIELFATDADSI